jgi:hypothetical protein
MIWSDMRWGFAGRVDDTRGSQHRVADSQKNDKKQFTAENCSTQVRLWPRFTYLQAGTNPRCGVRTGTRACASPNSLCDDMGSYHVHVLTGNSQFCCNGLQGVTLSYMALHDHLVSVTAIFFAIMWKLPVNYISWHQHGWDTKKYYNFRNKHQTFY